MDSLSPAPWRKFNALPAEKLKTEIYIPLK